MTENLYESSQFTNHTNGNYLFQHSQSAPHYSVPNVLHSSPMSPCLNHEHLASPVTPGNELSPLLDMPNSAGTWDYSQFGRGSSWGSSQDELSESGGVSRIHPFNIMCHNDSTTTSKDGCGAVLPQRLDSFSKAFPSKNIHLLFEDNDNRTVDKTSGDNHISRGSTLQQSGTFAEGSERQSLGSPVFNPMAFQGQTQTMSEFHLSDQNPLHGLYQTPQHFQYGCQQHKQTHADSQANRDLHKPQSPWLHQHAYQSHLPPFPINLNQQQQQHHLQPRGTVAHKTHLDCQEGHESTRSPTYRQDFREQQNFQGGHSLSLHSPHYQDQQYIHPFSHPSGVYQHQHSQEHVQPVPVKQSNVFHDGHLQSYDKHSAPNTPVFSSPKDDTRSSFNFSTHRSEDICLPHFSNKSSGVSQSNIFPHLPSHASQWSQASSPDIQSENISHYRAENGPARAEGSQARMRCTVCQREFKSLPALNGHMRSHGGFRTNSASLKAKEGQLHLSGDVFQSNPIILPVTVPVKNYQTPSKLPLGPQCHQKDGDRSPQSPLPPVRNQPSCIKRSVSDGECGSKQGKQRYRQCLVPLMIPPPGTVQESRGAVLFRSLLRTPGSRGDDVPYTPPPMLSPVRPGSGLFSAVCGGTESDATALHCSTSDADNCALTSGQKVINVAPHINIGEEFQAKIPEISQSLIEEDTHNAFLLWMPINNLNTPDNQQKVDNLLKMACSSVLPGGGTNTEYVLHCLFECRGDLMNTLEKLLLSWRNACGPKPDYHYAGSDSWSPQEKRLLNKALLTHHKDFYLVQKVVKTKTVAQCVEYYYTCKKQSRLGTRVSSALITPVQDQPGDWTVNLTTGTDRETKSTDNSHTSLFVCEVSQTNGKTLIQNNPGLLCSSPAEHRTSTLTPLGSGSIRSSPSNSTTSGDTDLAVVFPCTECGKVFFKVKSRNAHMKTHRQQEDTHLWQFPRAPEQNKGMTSSVCPVTPLKQPTSLYSADSVTDANTFSLNDVESMQDYSLKTVLQSQLDFVPS
ncbi:transcriptional-regulating factor 1 [Triplophysa rosa]|uniref:Transcriptional-regulating factor 1-like n=1 Tax=Triplophysa rosa TaxID=992332 RepID=A0A9W7WMS1_TRIRA|nr:transcriptional-regulating factor 1 [Triplophysa rosa]XP_057200728.1 transcriptional-regulating factor 1 [Triplophysa rosa]KAI7805057.1 putative transcriptional-regulating factor 1-like [Triplophysa rosa]